MAYLPIFLFLVAMAIGLWLLTRSDKLKGVERSFYQVFSWLLVGISLVMALSFVFLDLTGEEKYSTNLQKEKGEQLSGYKTDENGVPIGFKQKEGYLPDYSPTKDQK